MKRRLLLNPPGKRLFFISTLKFFLLGSQGLNAEDLLTALESAQILDPVYKEVQSSALATAEGIPQARAQLFMPYISIEAGTSRVEQDIELSGGFGQGGKVAFTTRNYQITLAQPIYHQDRWVALEQADLRLKKAQAEVIAAHQSLLLRVAERYFEVLAAKDNLAFAKAEKESLQSQLEQAEQRFEVGLIAITDVQEARAGRDRAVANEINGLNNVDNALEELRETTGLYLADLKSLGSKMPLAEPVPDDINAWTTNALQHNLDLRSSLLAVQVSEQEIKKQSFGHLPTLDLIGRHGYNRQGGRFGSSEITQGNIGFEFNLPIFEGGAVLSRTREARHKHNATLERLEQTKRSIQRQTRQAFLGVIAEISSVKALEQALISSEIALESTQAGFEVGTRTAIDVVSAERGLSEAKRDFARARYNYVLETLRLKKAAGNLNLSDLSATNSWLTK